MHGTTHSDVLIRVRGLRAARVHACDLATGNNDITVRFDIDPDDPVWADKALSASFEVVTHPGARVRDTAKVSLECAAKIPAAVLREPAKALYIGLHGSGGFHGTAAGSHAKHEDADTNMAPVGPVKPGAGGAGFFPGGHMVSGCGDEGWSWERIYHELLAGLSAVEPAARNALTTAKKSTAAVQEFRAELDAMVDAVGESGADVADLKQLLLTYATGDALNRGLAALREDISQSDAALPHGGAAGQVLTKASDADRDAAWMGIPEADAITNTELETVINNALKAIYSNST